MVENLCARAIGTALGFAIGFFIADLVNVIKAHNPEDI